MWVWIFTKSRFSYLSYSVLTEYKSILSNKSIPFHILISFIYAVHWRNNQNHTTDSINFNANDSFQIWIIVNLRRYFHLKPMEIGVFLSKNCDLYWFQNNNNAVKLTYDIRSTKRRNSLIRCVWTGKSVRFL